MERVKILELRDDNGLILNVSYSRYGLKFTTDALGRNLYRDEWVHPYNYTYHKPPQCPYIFDNGRMFLREGVSDEDIKKWREFTDRKSAEKRMKEKYLALVLQDRYDPNFKYND